MGSLSIWHWLIVLVIVMLGIRYQEAAQHRRDLGGAVRGFKDGMAKAATRPPKPALRRRSRARRSRRSQGEDRDQSLIRPRLQARTGVPREGQGPFPT